MEHRVILTTGETITVRDAEIHYGTGELILTTPNATYRFNWRHVAYLVSRRRP